MSAIHSRQKGEAVTRLLVGEGVNKTHFTAQRVLEELCSCVLQWVGYRKPSNQKKLHLKGDILSTPGYRKAQSQHKETLFLSQYFSTFHF